MSDEGCKECGEYFVHCTCSCECNVCKEKELQDFNNRLKFYGQLVVLHKKESWKNTKKIKPPEQETVLGFYVYTEECQQIISVWLEKDQFYFWECDGLPEPIRPPDYWKQLNDRPDWMND